MLRKYAHESTDVRYHVVGSVRQCQLLDGMLVYTKLCQFNCETSNLSKSCSNPFPGTNQYYAIRLTLMLKETTFDEARTQN